MSDDIIGVKLPKHILVNLKNITTQEREVITLRQSLRTVIFDSAIIRDWSGRIAKLEHDNEFRRELVMHDLLKWYSEEGKHYE